MFERENNTPEQDKALEMRFDSAQSYWKKALDEGRIYRTQFFTQAFDSPESKLYRERCDDELILYVAKTLNGLWVGDERWKNMQEVHSILPAPSASSSTSTTGRSATKSRS